MTLSRNPELWQSQPAEKQHELENSPEFIAIEEELEKLPFGLEDDPAARDRRRKELHTQKRKACICGAPQMPEASTKETAL